MEVFFVDVAQGTCHVILLGGRRAIVIDCGCVQRKDQFILKFLHRMNVEFIERLIVSHSHNDHSGGAVAVLGDYAGDFVFFFLRQLAGVAAGATGIYAGVYKLSA